MPPDPATTPIREEIQSTSKLTKLLMLLVLCVGVLLVLSYIFTLTPFGSRLMPLSGKSEGAIYLSLSPEATETVGIYRFDIDDSTLRESFVRKNTTSINPVLLGSDGTMVFSSNVILDGNYEGKDPTRMQLFSFDAERGLRQLTSTNTYFKREPVFDEVSGSIYYAGRAAKENEGALNLDVWQVYRLTQDGREELMTVGSHPLLSPDGKYLLVLRSDGLYSVDTTTREFSSVVGMGGEFHASSNMQLDLSRDGTLLALSSPAEGKIYIFTIASWDPFEITLDQAIESYGFWPVFSPDGKQVAFEEVDGPNLANPRLVIFDIETAEKETVLDLTDFIQERMFVDTWVQE